MADSKLSALTAASAIAAADLVYGSQSSASVKMTAAQVKTFCSASPTLVTPVLGVGAGTSLALGGATIGTDALGVTGTATFNGNITIAGTAAISQPSAATNTLGGSITVGGSNNGSVFLNRAGGFGSVEVRSVDGYSWSSSATDQTATPDLCISRANSSTMQIGTGGTNASGSLNLTNLTASGAVTVASAVATPAAGSTSARLLFGTTAGFGIYYGSGAPTVSAAQGSVYLRSDGSSTSTRMYVNTTGSTTWTNVTTAA